MNTYEVVNKTEQTQGQIIDRHEMNTAVALLNDLINLNRGIVDVYETAVIRLENSDNIRLLHGYITQHQRFLAELSNLVIKYKGQPDDGGGIDGSFLLKQVWVSLKAAVTEGDGPILAEVAEDAKQILTAYGQAMSKDIPEEARQLIRSHLSDARLAHKKLVALSAAFNS